MALLNNNREYLIAGAALATGVILTIGTQKGVKALKNRAARRKAAKMKGEMHTETVETTSADGKQTYSKEKVDITVNTALGKLPNESDEDYIKRMNSIANQANEAKNKNVKANA